VTTEEAQQAHDVVLGMFFASTHPAIVLFYSGASHSFISSAFVAKHHLPMLIIKHTMLVSSSGGEMRTKHICLAVSITIRGVEFLENLIILDSKGIDIILSMYWLRKYDRDILCAKRVVRLTTENDTTVEFSAVMTTDQANMLHQVHGNSLEEADVFRKELPDMLPDRDIEFNIDLLPGTPPISMRRYRMPVNELVKLKKQIVKLQSNGFICPSSFPWGAPMLFVEKKDGTQ
jgi:hypothetical protein